MIQRRTGIAIPDQLPVRIDSGALTNKGSPIIGIEKIFGARLILDAVDGRGLMDERTRAVGINDQIGRKTENVSPASITVKTVAD